eukprot:Tamp_22954.p1 GENE.Tamp_22954~~Tamp_22954.p1  ORF type:complete len:165 (-),score=23.93 Tamp_22954:4-498(-)
MDARQHQPLAALAVHAGCYSSCCCGAYVAAHTSFVAPATPAPAAGGVGLEEASAASEASPLPPAQELQRQLSHLQEKMQTLVKVAQEADYWKQTAAAYRAAALAHHVHGQSVLQARLVPPEHHAGVLQYTPPTPTTTSKFAAASVAASVHPTTPSVLYHGGAHV